MIKRKRIILILLVFAFFSSHCFGNEVFENKKYGVSFEYSSDCRVQITKDPSELGIDGLVQVVDFEWSGHANKGFRFLLDDIRLRKTAGSLETEKPFLKMYRQLSRAFKIVNIGKHTGIASISCGSAACHWDFHFLIDHQIEITFNLPIESDIRFDDYRANKELPYRDPENQACSVFTALKTLRVD